VKHARACPDEPVHDAARNFQVGDMEMIRAALIGSLALTLAPAAAFADMSYSNVELKYLNLSLSDSVVNVNGDGFALAGQYSLGDKMFLLGEWQEQSYDFGIDGHQYEIGAGFHHAINSTLDFVGTLSYLDSKVDVGPFNVSDNGFGLGAGVRTRLAKDFELDAALKYVDFDKGGSDTGVSANGRWYFKKTMALSFGIDSTDNVDVWHLGFRAEF
jgi:opacity protein-like surface antigen